jgi:hypothetical protein
MHAKTVVRSAFLLITILLVAASAAGQEKARLVLKGYDPVAYFTEGRALQGDPRYAYDWDDGRYHFASERHRDMFAADPQRYAPQFAGYCTGSMSRGVRNEGNPLAWVIADGRLYVFGAADAAAAAKAKADAEKDLAAFRVKAAKAAGHWAKAR